MPTELLNAREREAVAKIFLQISVSLEGYIEDQNEKCYSAGARRCSWRAAHGATCD